MFQAEAQLTVRPRGLLFRALRADEVARDAGGGRRLRAGQIVPKQRPSTMTVAQAVGTGSAVHESPYVHTTADVLVAAYFAQGGRGGSGLVAVIDSGRLERRRAPRLDPHLVHRHGLQLPRRGHYGGERGFDRARRHLAGSSGKVSVSATASRAATRRATRELESWE